SPLPLATSIRTCKPLSGTTLLCLSRWAITRRRSSRNSTRLANPSVFRSGAAHSHPPRRICSAAARCSPSGRHRLRAWLAVVEGRAGSEVRGGNPGLTQRDGQPGLGVVGLNDHGVVTQAGVKVDGIDAVAALLPAGSNQEKFSGLLIADRRQADGHEPGLLT